MQTNNAQTSFVPFPQMVENLFKKLDTDAATLHHATTGMAGETAELLEAYLEFTHIPLREITNEHLDKTLKEVGDWRFYAQAVWNIYGWEVDSFVLPMPGSSGGLRTALDYLIIHSGAMLDMSKKDWAANKGEPDTRDLYEQMEHALAAYFDVLFYMGWSDEAVCAANRDKLAKRHPSGVYSDAGQNNRADEAEEFKPKFKANDAGTVVA